MIIFYNTQTGGIVGTIEGRVHDVAHLNVGMTVSGVDPDHIDKIVCQWKKTGEEELPDGTIAAIFEPDHPQKDIFLGLDKHPTDVYNFKVKLDTRELVPK